VTGVGVEVGPGVGVEVGPGVGVGVGGAGVGVGVGGAGVGVGVCEKTGPLVEKSKKSVRVNSLSIFIDFLIMTAPFAFQVFI